MKFAPFRATGIFLIAMLVPGIPFIVTFARRAPLAVGLLVGLLLISAILFWAGARVAGRPHTVKSLVLAILVTWSFNYATTGLLRGFLPDVRYTEQLTDLLQLVFVFMVGWRFAPKVPPAAVG